MSFSLSWSYLADFGEVDRADSLVADAESEDVARRVFLENHLSETDKKPILCVPENAALRLGKESDGFAAIHPQGELAVRDRKPVDSLQLLTVVFAHVGLQFLQTERRRRIVTVEHGADPLSGSGDPHPPVSRLF